MEKNKLSLRTALITFLVAFALSQVVIIFAELILSSILTAKHFSSTEITNWTYGCYGYLILALCQSLSFVGVFIYFYKKSSIRENLVEEKLKALPTILFLTLGIICMLSLSYFVNSVSLFLNLCEKASTTISYSINSTSKYLISLISLALLPAIGEELLFRGVLLNSCKYKGKLFAIITSSILFTLFHFNLSQLYYPLLFGFLLGSSYVLTKNILTPILIHFVNNALNISIQYFFNSSTQTLSVLTNILTVVGVLVFLCIVALLLYMLYKQEKDEVNTPMTQETNVEEQKKNPATSNLKQIKQFLKSDKFILGLCIVTIIVLYIIIAFLGA